MAPQKIQLTNTLAYYLSYSTRKTICLSIKDMQLYVKAPHHYPVTKINKFVLSKTNWIEKKLTEKRLIDKCYPRNQIRILGQLININLQNKQLYLTAVENTFNQYINYPSYIPIIKANTLASIKQYLLDLMQIVINDRLKYWCDLMQLYPKKVTIKAQKTRWGSASSLANINFNWRLIELPVTLIDSVIVHELAHLQHLNHSAEFWQLVATYLPNYLELKCQMQQYSIRTNWQQMLQLEFDDQLSKN